MSENQYDGGGVGNGNLTKVSAYPGGGATVRATTMFCDWRNRLVAQRSGADSGATGSTTTCAGSSGEV